MHGESQIFTWGFSKREATEEGDDFKTRNLKDLYGKERSRAGFVLTISFGFISLGPSGNVYFQMGTISGQAVSNR